MNFFKSVFSDDPDPPSSSNPPETHHQTTPDGYGSHPDQDQDQPSWSFGGLIKTLQVKSDWIDTYRRDLEEFGSGLRKETELLREVASKAVKDLPTSIEISASKAQTSLESVGQAVDSVWNSTADIISQGKASLLVDNDSADGFDVVNNNVGIGSGSALNVPSVGRYSRFDAQLRAIQCDVTTFVEEPEDVREYDEWRAGFDLEEKRAEIEGLLRENESVDGIYKRVVPDSVEHDVFWSRYYYRVHRLQQAENVRANLVKRAISTQDEEELSWDVDEEEEDDENEGKNVDERNKDEKKHNEDPSTEQTMEKVAELEIKGEAQDAELASNKQASKNEIQSEGNQGNDGKVMKQVEEKVVANEGKAEPSESGKDSDISVVSTQPSAEDDDMGWDEIEDIGSEDEKKTTQRGSPNRVELRKRLSVAADEDEEDLSWDIEDDDDGDQPVKP